MGRTWDIGTHTSPKLWVPLFHQIPTIQVVHGFSDKLSHVTQDMFLLFDLIPTKWSSKYFAQGTFHYMERDKHLKMSLPPRSQFKDLSIPNFPQKMVFPSNNRSLCGTKKSGKFTLLSQDTKAYSPSSPIILVYSHVSHFSQDTGNFHGNSGLFTKI